MNIVEVTDLKDNDMKYVILNFLSASALAALLLGGSSLYAKGNTFDDTTLHQLDIQSDIQSDIQPDIKLDEKTRFKKVVPCSLNGPAEIQGFRVQCQSATYLDFRISDGFIPGDHWSLKGKNWDKAPNTAVTTSPGKVIQYGVPARIYNYGGTPQNPGNLDAYVQCSYLHGVDIFGAGSFVLFSSDASNCSITTDRKRSRIDRMP